MMLTPVVRNILLLNVLVFFFTTRSTAEQFGLHSFLSEQFNPIQLLTHMFIHDGLGHIFGNMFGLFIFGPMLERTWGPRRFTFFYLFCGIGAALLFSGINYYEMRGLHEASLTYRSSPTPDGFLAFVMQYAPGAYNETEDFIVNFQHLPTNPTIIGQSVRIVNSIYDVSVNEPLVGASGAIFGIIMGFGLLFPNTQFVLLFPPIPVKAKYIVIFYGAYELYNGVRPTQGDNVAHFAHIGGMLFAFILISYWGAQRKTFY